MSPIWRIREVQPARATVDVAVVLTARADAGRVDDGQHLLDVALDQPVKQRFVAVLQGTEEDVALKLGVAAPEVLVRARELLLDRRHVRRQQAEQTELAPLILGERAAFVSCSGLSSSASPCSSTSSGGCDMAVFAQRTIPAA